MLGDHLSTALANLTQLIKRTPDQGLRKQLLDQQDQLAGMLQAAIDDLAAQALPEYAAATAALEEANRMAEAAKADLDKVAATITAMAKAAGKVMALAVKVGI